MLEINIQVANALTKKYVTRRFKDPKIRPKIFKSRAIKFRILDYDYYFLKRKKFATK